MLSLLHNTYQPCLSHSVSVICGREGGSRAYEVYTEVSEQKARITLHGRQRIRRRNTRRSNGRTRLPDGLAV